MSFKSKTEVLSKKHDKKDFKCGEISLDIYIKKYAYQDLKRKLSGVFVLANEENLIKGYYTLSSSSISQSNLPESFLKKFPAYEYLPVTLLGRLAVDRKFQGEGIGETLLLDALYKAYYLSQNIGSIAVMVEALNAEAAKFYKNYGFIELVNHNKLFLPMKTIQSLVS